LPYNTTSLWKAGSDIPYQQSEVKMKAIRVLMIVSVLVALAAVVMPAGAISTYDSCFQVANMEDTDAQVAIAYYNQDGTTAASVNDTIPASGSKTYCPLNAVSPGFNGSVVISSDKKVAAITNVNGDGSAFWGSYAGLTGGAQTVALPLVMKANYGFSTWFNVQNTGSSATDVTVTYSNGATEPLFSNLPPGAAHTFNQATSTGLPSGFSGSAVASASTGGQIAVAVMEVGPTTLLAYEGFAQSSQFPVMPLVNANNYNYATGIAVQNTGATTTTVRIAYTPASGSPGTACYEQRDIAPGKSKNYALYAFTYSGDTDSTFTTNCAHSSTGQPNDQTKAFVGAGVVVSNTASVPLNVIVNQLNSSANKGASYDAFDPANATNAVVFPLIMDRNYNYWTGFTVVNVGTSTTDVSCTFTGSSRTVSASNLAPGAALLDTQINQIASGYTGAATCTASGGSDNKIVGVVNELNSVASGDTFMTYEGSNK
jgi:hypothetical protein